VYAQEAGGLLTLFYIHLKETVILFSFPGVLVSVLLRVCFLAFVLPQALVSLQTIHEGTCLCVSRFTVAVLCPARALSVFTSVWHFCPCSPSFSLGRADTLNWFRVMLSLNRKLPWRLRFSHFYRQPLRAIRYCLCLSCLPCFLQCVVSIAGPQSFHFLLVPPAAPSPVLPVRQGTPKRILVFNSFPLLLSRHQKCLE